MQGATKFFICIKDGPNNLKKGDRYMIRTNFWMCDNGKIGMCRFITFNPPKGEYWHVSQINDDFFHEYFMESKWYIRSLKINKICQK